MVGRFDAWMLAPFRLMRSGATRGVPYAVSMSLCALRRRNVARLVWLLLVPALALRFMVPPGFMPGTDEGHGLTMQMCHGTGPLPNPMGHDPGQPQPRHDSPCVFAAAGTVAPPPVLSLVATGIVHEFAEPAPSVSAIFHRAPPRAHAARAPPGSTTLA